MFYREAGQFKTSYAADMAMFPLRQDRIGIAVDHRGRLAVAFTGSDFLAPGGPDPVPDLRACGDRAQPPDRLCRPPVARHRRLHGRRRLRLLQADDGLPGREHSSSGSWSRASSRPAIGVLFGLPSLRIKGFYLAVATLAAQFFLQWCFNRVPWLYNYNVSGAIEVPLRTLFGVPIVGPTATAADALPRGPRPSSSCSPGSRRTSSMAASAARGWRSATWTSRPSSWASSSCRRSSSPSRCRPIICGVAGAMMVFLWYGGAEYNVFDINQCFIVLFMVIIGGLGSLIGSFFGAAFIFDAADAARVRPAGDPRPSAVDRAATVEHLTLHHRRGAHHLLPDRRAARPRAALADRQTEASGLAVPLLSGRGRRGRAASRRRRSSRKQVRSSDRLPREELNVVSKLNLGAAARSLHRRRSALPAAGAGFDLRPAAHLPDRPLRRLRHSDRRRHARLSRAC